jgi:hypothetical protein
MAESQAGAKPARRAGPIARNPASRLDRLSSTASVALWWEQAWPLLMRSLSPGVSRRSWIGLCSTCRRSAVSWVNGGCSSWRSGRGPLACLRLRARTHLDRLDRDAGLTARPRSGSRRRALALGSNDPELARSGSAPASRRAHSATHGCDPSPAVRGGTATHTRARQFSPSHSARSCGPSMHPPRGGIRLARAGGSRPQFQGRRLDRRRSTAPRPS